MSLARFVCPHCEKQAEVQVTSVTRSRPCPFCGNMVLLQVSQKEVKGTRRALLINDDPEAVALEMEADEHHSISGPAYEPVALEGDVFERMKMDPEIKVFRRRLYTGAGVVAGLIVLACVWSWFFADVFMGEPEPVFPSAPAMVKPPPVAADAPMPKNTVGLRHTEQKKANAAGGTLNFQSATNANTETEALPADGAADERTKKIMAVVEKFLLASNVDALLETVARRVTTEPLIRREAARHAITPLNYRQIKLSTSDIDEAGCEVVAVVDLSDGSQRMAYVMMEANEPKVEWPSFVRWSAMEWGKFMEKKPRKPVLFRVMAEEAQRFDQEFIDAKALRCIRLSNPNDAKAPPLFAYAERTSSIGDEIDFLLRQTPGKPIKLTLRLKYPLDTSGNDQVWIDSVVEAGWVISDAQSNAQAAVVK